MNTVRNCLSSGTKPTLSPGSPPPIPEQHSSAARILDQRICVLVLSAGPADRVRSALEAEALPSQTHSVSPLLSQVSICFMIVRLSLLNKTLTLHLDVVFQKDSNDG